jgi:hypothetical protein
MDFLRMTSEKLVSILKKHRSQNLQSDLYPLQKDRLSKGNSHGPVARRPHSSLES